jgi:hypothetical protein
MKSDYVILGVGALCAGPAMFLFMWGQSSSPLGFASTTDDAGLNCTSRGLQRAGLVVTHYDEWWGDHRLHFVDGFDDGIATIAKEPAGHLEVTTRTYRHPTKIPLERARALTRRAYDGVAQACGLGEPREICSRHECVGAELSTPLTFFKKYIDAVRALTG